MAKDTCYCTEGIRVFNNESGLWNWTNIKIVLYKNMQYKINITQSWEVKNMEIKWSRLEEENRNQSLVYLVLI
jgi:hypothetical protein